MDISRAATAARAIHHDARRDSAALRLAASTRCGRAADARRRAAPRRRRSRQLAAQDVAVTASREMAVAAGQLPDPGKVGMTTSRSTAPTLQPDARFHDHAPHRRDAGTDPRRQAQVRAERYEREADKSLAEKSRPPRSSAIPALAWLDRYYAEAMAAVVAEQSRQARLEIEAAETAYRAGRGSQADVLAARGALVALDDRASELGRRVSAARIALARWIGEAAAAPLAGKPPIDTIGSIPERSSGAPAPPADRGLAARRTSPPPRSGWRRRTGSRTGAWS